MKTHLLLGILLILATGCKNTPSSKTMVADHHELKKAISDAKPGDEIVMINGEWSDVQIRFYGNGTNEKPITLRAETPGKVIIRGESGLKLGGEFLIVNGLLFTDGSSPSPTVIQFALNDDTLANHSQVTNCAIIDFNKAQRNMSDIWVLFKGQHNKLDRCYLTGKSNRGPTVRVDLEGNQSIRNYHQIKDNHFGPRPPKGGPSAETIQIGNSSTSMAPSYTLVENNLFDRCNGEVEVISSKSNFNEFRNNIFYKSEGSLVTRHGNYCLVDGNYFIGDEGSPHVGGVRLIGTGHWVTNNYFYNLRGEIFRGPLALMNGIHRPAVNRYFQVTDVVVAYNTWVDCKSPWQIGVGSNVDQKDVLPPSEIRSETPIRTIIANNLIFNSTGDEMPIVRYDSLNGIDFYSNIINNKAVNFRGVKGLEEKDFSMKEVEENIYVPSISFSDVKPYRGFEFDQITNDLFGNPRSADNSIGAVSSTNLDNNQIIEFSRYGPDWFDSKAPREPNKKLSASNVEELMQALQNVEDGDTIDLTADRYALANPIKINQKLVIKSNEPGNKASLIYTGPAHTPAFEMHPGGQLFLQSIFLRGNGKNYAFASLKEQMSSLYNLNVIDCEVSNFDYVLKGYKYSFSEYIKFNSTTIKNCNNGIELSSEDDDRGEYNAENVLLINCKFEKVLKNVIDYYRGGYDESTVGGNLIVQDCEFTNCGGEEDNGILINTYGIINVEISNNRFLDNPVNLVARLWGAKNNSEHNNKIENSGKIVTEQNLPLKLMY